MLGSIQAVFGSIELANAVLNLIKPEYLAVLCSITLEKSWQYWVVLNKEEWKTASARSGTASTAAAAGLAAPPAPVEAALAPPEAPRRS